MGQKYFVEAIGSFFLVLTVGLVSIEPDAGVIGPLAIGAILMVMVFAGGHISGGHYNPAVTLGAWMRGATPSHEALLYVIVQLAGAAVAAFAVIWFRFGETGTPIVHDIPRSLAAEFLFTFALVFVVLNSAVAKDNQGNSFYGLSIGFTVLVGAFTVGGISGGAFNPGVALGLSIMKIAAWGDIWIYLVAQIAGGVAAAIVYKYVNDYLDDPTEAAEATE